MSVEPVVLVAHVRLTVVVVALLAVKLVGDNKRVKVSELVGIYIDVNPLFIVEIRKK